MGASTLGELEQLVLLAVLQIDGEAYAASVRDELSKRTDRDVARAAVHVTLDRLEQKGFLRSTPGEPKAERGGRPRRVFTITATGTSALQDTLGALRQMTRGLSGRLRWSTS
ncbi:MAG: PadR family transcriptional regulator [Gemmatimonadaceae bacterium]|nr:PadR family transcriptional regulator [Gemmatimonadaceae bacterium]MDQ3243273.1 PadR family transcriptional regulator [Gemmatimonadota bacterium]